jgi:hypothetical protein
MTERETLLAEIAERQARLAEIDAEPDYEAWRPALEAYIKAAGWTDLTCYPLDETDKATIRGLIAAFAKAPPMGKCPTCGKDYSDGLVCSDAFHLPAGTPTYWPPEEKGTTWNSGGSCGSSVATETLSRVQPRWPSEAELREMAELVAPRNPYGVGQCFGMASRIRAYQTGEQP